MANYDANIKVNADTRQAESQLKKLQTSLDKLSDISSKVNLQNAQQQFNKLGTALKGIGERGALGAITLGAGKATVAIGGLGAKMGVVGAAAASMGAAVNGALGGVPSVITDILAQVGNIPNAFGLAAVAAMAFAPQVLKASSATVSLGAAIDKAVGAQTTQKIADVVNSVGRLNTELEATKVAFADLIAGSTLNQLNSQLKDAVYQSGEFHSSTEDAVTAAQQLVAVQKEQRREQKAITDLIRQAQGLQPQDVRDTEVARRVALLKSREIQQKKDLQLQNQINAELAEYERLAAEVANQTKQWANNLDRIARSSKAGVLGSQSQIQARLQEFRENRRSVDIARQRSAELLGGQYSLTQVPARGELFPGGRTQTAMEQYRSMLNEQARIQQAAASALQRSERTLIGLQAQTLRTEQDITAAKRQQQTIDERSIQTIREQNKLLLEQYRAEQRVASGTLDPASLRADRLRRVEQGRAQQRRRREMTENVIIGGAFPMLFGGGPGAVLGGAAGGFIPGNPMLSVATSAIGAVIDEFAASAADLGAALNPATANFETLIQALGLTGTATAEYINKLETLERQDEALAVATEEMARLVGYDGVRALKDFGSAATELSSEWSKAMTRMQAALAGLLAGPLQALANQLESANLYRQAQASSDPRIQELIQQRNRPGIVGGSGNRSINDITNEIVELQRKANAEAQKREQIETATTGTLDQQRRVLEAQLNLAYTDGDLTKDKVYQLQQILIDKEFELKLQQAINDNTNVNLVQLERKVKLQQLAVQREQALQAAAEKTATELERQRKEMERMAKLRRDQLSDAQRGFVLAELDLNVVGTNDEKARAQAEFDRRRAERMFEYTEALQKALSEEERMFLMGKQENEIFRDNLILSKELFSIDLQRAEILNAQDPLSTLQQEIDLLAAKLQGKEEEYVRQQAIDALVAKGVVLEDAIAQIDARTQLNAKLQEQLQLEQLIGTVGQGMGDALTNVFDALIARTDDFNGVLRNTLASLGRFLMMAGLNALADIGDPSGQGTGILSFLGFGSGFGKRAAGGPVTGNTPYVVGERGPELFVPGTGGTVVNNNDLRSAMGTAPGARNGPMLNMTFQTTNIGGVEYVSREQLEAAMAATRKAAANDGARQGTAATLSKLQQSPSTRAKLGLR